LPLRVALTGPTARWHRRRQSNLSNLRIECRASPRATEAAIEPISDLIDGLRRGAAGAS
jgi:hypothetical protein